MKIYWIHKGDSNFCSELVLDEDYETMVKQKPDGFYDIISEADTIEGGTKVVAFEDHAAIVAELEARIAKLREALDALSFIGFNGYSTENESIVKYVSNLAAKALAEDNA